MRNGCLMTEQDAEQSDKLRDYARDFILGVERI